MNEIDGKKSLKKFYNWWPLLAGPVALAIIAIWYHFMIGSDKTETKALYNTRQNLNYYLETASIFLPMAAASIYWLKALWTRNMTFVILMVLCSCLLLRELHWSGDMGDIKTAIYPLLAMVGIWALVWRDLMDKPWVNPRLTIFLFSALATYGLAQFVEKRVFENYIPLLPYTKHTTSLKNIDIHTQYEEVTEFAGHVLLLTGAIVASCKRKVVENRFLEK